MTPTNLGAIVSQAWDDALELARWGSAPLTIGWLRGQAYVKVWDFRSGSLTWRPFVTSRPQPPTPPRWDPFSSRALFEAFF